MLVVLLVVSLGSTLSSAGLFKPSPAQIKSMFLAASPDDIVSYASQHPGKVGNYLNKYPDVIAQHPQSAELMQKLKDNGLIPQDAKAPSQGNPNAPAEKPSAPEAPSKPESPANPESASQKPDSSKPSDQKPETPQNSEPIKPQDVMDSKEKECKLDSENDKSPDPNRDPCSKEKKCGYDSCSFFYKSKGEKDCKQFVQSKKDYDKAKAEWQAAPPSQKPQKQQEMEQKKKKADEDGSKCCASRKAAEGLQRLIQGNPCGGMLKGNPLTGGSLDDCKPWILSSNCPVKDPKQLQQLYNDRGFMKSLTAKDLPTIKNMMSQGLTNYGDLKNVLSEGALNSLSPSGSGKVSVQGGPASPADLKLDSKAGTVTAGNNEYQASQLKDGASSVVDPGKGTVARTTPTGSVKMQPGPAGTVNPVAFSGNTATIISYGQMTADLAGVVDLYSAGVAAGVKVAGLYQRYGPVLSAFLTGAVVYEPTQLPITVSFFPDPPPLPGPLGVNVGRVFDDWFDVVPRANSRIDFDGVSGGAVTAIIQNMGVPRGSSEMADPRNLGEKTAKMYTIDGTGDYDMIVNQGLVIWTGSRAVGGRIISSSSGISPDRYLSRQQKGMVYS